MFYRYTPLGNAQVKVLRYGKKVLVDGFYQRPDIEVLDVRATIVPFSKLENLKKRYGEEVKAGIQYFSTLKNSLQIEDQGTGADVIYWDTRFWSVASVINHRIILLHTESDALLMTHPPDELKTAVGVL